MSIDSFLGRDVISINYPDDFKPLNFCYDKFYKLDLSGSVSFGPISKSRLDNIFTGGSIAGQIVEPLLSSTFSNLFLVEGQKEYDLQDSYGKIIEVKTITSGGLTTCISSMVGAGRSYNREKHLSYLDLIDYFIIVDTTKYYIDSIYYVYPLKSCHKLAFGETGRISYREFFKNIQDYLIEGV